MPGYDRSRFVNLSQTEYDEFKCGICFDILRNPIVVPCCRHAYCGDCIGEWLASQPTCPNDRTQLEARELYKPQRLVLNLLAKLTIICEFRGRGCDQILLLECLSSHVLNCPYNPERKCADCGLEVGNAGAHQCIASLKLVNASLSNEVSTLKKEIEKLNRDIELMRESRHEYDHINEVLASARRKIRYPEIIYCSIPASLRVKAVEKSREAIQLFDSYYEITRYLNAELNRDSNYKLLAIAHARHCGESIVVNENGYIDIRFGQLRIAIFSAGCRSSPLTPAMINSRENHIQSN